MRWVILTDDHPPAAGGVATFTAATADALRRAGHDVRVYARRRPGLEAAVGVGGPSFGRHGGTWLGLRAAARIATADAVLATTWPVATFARRCAGDRLHVVAHGSDVTRPPVRPGSDVVWRDARAGRWAVSRFLAAVLHARGVAAAVIPMPVSPAVARPVPTSLRSIGLVARATPWKGGERAIRLAAALGVSCVVAGDGPALPAWRAVAAAAGADARFLGGCSHAAALDVLGSVDAAVLLPRARPDGSGAEGLGLVLLEAAARGVPAIGCATGGVPEAVGPGLVLDDPDDADASAASVRSWWAPRRGEDAREWLDATHGPERTVAALTGAR